MRNGTKKCPIRSLWAKCNTRMKKRQMILDRKIGAYIHSCNVLVFRVVDSGRPGS